MLVSVFFYFLVSTQAVSKRLNRGKCGTNILPGIRDTFSEREQLVNSQDFVKFHHPQILLRDPLYKTYPRKQNRKHNA